jgi:hypothetical protein
MEIYLCTWHVERCWISHLIRKVKCPDTRKEIFYTLQIILTRTQYMSREEALSWLQQQLQELYDKFAAWKEFIKYFKETWEPKTGACLPSNHIKSQGNLDMPSNVSYAQLDRSSLLSVNTTLPMHNVAISSFVCCTEMRAMNLRKARRRNQNTTSAIEGYHAGLKSSLTETKQQLRAMAVAWLMYALIHVVEPKFRRQAALKLVLQTRSTLYGRLHARVLRLNF